MTVRSTPRRSRRLFWKYVWLLVALLSAMLIVSACLEIYYSYQENKKALLSIQTKEALAAAGRIEQLIAEVERRIALMVESQWGASVQQLSLEYLRLLREVPAITEVGYLDASGKEQLRLSRLALDRIGSQQDLAGEESFLVAKSGKTYFSPVSFREESEPYMKVAVAGTGADAGVAIAEVDLKLIWEVISRIKIGKAGHAHVVDAGGLLVAHPNISLVLRKTSLASMPHVRDALRHVETPFVEAAATIARDPQGRQVLTAFAPIPLLGWTVFVEQPLAEAFEPLYASIVRTGVIGLVGLALSILASLFLARTIVRPIQALQAGADKIGAGAFDQRIEIRSGDELEALAEAFNRMGAQLQESYAGLEQKVEARTRELADANADLTESLEQQTATAEILRVISRSPTDFQPVLDVVAESATRLCDAKDVTIALVDGDVLRVVASRGVLARWWPDEGVPIGRGSVTGRAVVDRQTVHIHDLASESDEEFPQGKVYQRRGGQRTNLAVPLLREGVAIGVIAMRRGEVHPFTDRQVGLLETFADQAAIAIENVRLFRELQARTQELTRSVEELTALGEVGQAVSSTLDLDKVLTTIVTHAVQLSKTDGGTIYEFDEAEQVFVPRANYGVSTELVEALRESRIQTGDESAIGQASATRALIQIPDLLNVPEDSSRSASPAVARSSVTGAGFRALLAVPMLREDRIIGALVVRRKAAGEFPKETLDLLQTLASQSVLAIQNARLFREIAEKSRQLEVASRHKSEFLASMSHELRTPLNAILGFNEMILGQVYGEVPPDLTEPLRDIENSGKHLLRLINNVLDLSKIEAGRMELALGDYSVQDTVERVRASLRSLAEEEGLGFVTSVPEDIPLAYGDGGRIVQCLMNLAGNALKFTREGRVEISVELQGDLLVYRVADTGIGIPADKLDTVFSEFRQGDATITSEFGGTGLGLSITKKFVEMHRGRIWVESELGKGSTFFIAIPLRLDGGTTA